MTEESHGNTQREGTPAERDQARAWFAEGRSYRAIGRELGFSHQTIRAWAARSDRAGDPWSGPGGSRDISDPATDAELDAARRRSEEARANANLRWANRRAAEADAAGVMASYSRQKVRDALESGRPNPQLIRAAVAAYETFVNTAQLLGGGATARTNVDLITGNVSLDGPTPAAVSESVRARAFSLLQGEG